MRIKIIMLMQKSVSDRRRWNKMTSGGLTAAGPTKKVSSEVAPAWTLWRSSQIHAQQVGKSVFEKERRCILSLIIFLSIVPRSIASWHVRSLGEREKVIEFLSFCSWWCSRKLCLTLWFSKGWKIALLYSKWEPPSLMVYPWLLSFFKWDDMTETIIRPFGG